MRNSLGLGLQMSPHPLVACPNLLSLNAGSLAPNAAQPLRTSKPFAMITVGAFHTPQRAAPFCAFQCTSCSEQTASQILFADELRLHEHLLRVHHIVGRRDDIRATHARLVVAECSKRLDAGHCQSFPAERGGV